MLIKLTAFHLDTGDANPMAPKTFEEYTLWVQRGAERGFKALDLGCGVVRFVSDNPQERCVFTARLMAGCDNG